MGTHYGGPVYRSVSEITGPSGFYNVKTSLGTVVVYVNQSYDGGGWVLVIANRSDTGGMNNLNYYDAVHRANYRINGVNTPPKAGNNSLANLNCWVGLRYWQELTGRVTAGKITVVQYVSGTNGVELQEGHTKRYRWRFNNFTTTYAFSGVEAVSDETSTGSPGLYNYHALSGFSLTTFDNDQDVHPNNCSTFYNNEPWWYGACWSGNYFGYGNRPYWESSGGDNHQYGAIYIK